MAVFESLFYADSMKMTMGVTIIVPQKKHIRNQKSPEIRMDSFACSYPLLLLLHDEASSQGELLRMTALERYATEHNIMVAMPDGMLGFYVDYFARDPGHPIPGVKYSNPEIEAKFTELQFETYICEELLPYIRNVFPASSRREDTYIGGIGMGGFGAVRLALKYSESFSKVFSVNGYLDIQWLMDHDSGRKEQFQAIFGGNGRLDPESDSNLPGKISQAIGKPAIYQVWSEKHMSREMNENFARAAGNRADYQKEIDEDKADFGYLDKILQKMLNWVG